MGPKKGKQVDGETEWRTSIEEAVLNDETWNVKVILIEAAGSDQDRIYLSKFELYAADEKRFVIKNICKTETIFMVNQLGGEKKVKDDHLRVFEEGQAYLKDKKDIPADIQALIIKHLILKMKEEYIFIKMQKLEVKKGMRNESSTMIDRAEVRGTVNVKSPEPIEPMPPSPKGKGKKNETDVPMLPPETIEGKKYNTLLRVRGEEWRDKVYVDDFPIDGPNIYVAVTGFVEPYLPGCLLKIGIPLTAIVQIRIDPTSSKVPSTLFRATKRGQSQTEILTEKSLQFWEDLQSLRIHRDSSNDFKTTAFIIFSPPYLDTDSLSGNPDKIYDEVCFLMYDIQDLTRQHIHYLENMNIINIPEEEGEELYKKYYDKLIDELPLECVTTFLVLDSILQAICKSEQVDNSSSKSSLLTTKLIDEPKSTLKIDEKTEKAEALVKNVFSSLCKSNTNLKFYRITYGEEYESHKDPIIINYGDSARYSSFHLGNMNFNNIWSALVGMPINKVWKNQGQHSGELEAKINFHVNVLLSCFDRQDVETAELNRLLHILACRKLYNNRSSLKKQHLPPSTISDFKKVYLKRSVLAEPLPTCPSLHQISSIVMPTFPTMSKSENESRVSSADDPEVQRINFLFDCPDISELVSAAEIANGKPLNHMIDDFELFEDFTGISALQIILEAFDKFNCVDYKYCEVTDCFILMFYNSYDKDGIAREEWRCHLPTPVCLQDFFDFVLEENHDWIQNEENLYDEQLIIKKRSMSKDMIDPYALNSCIENTEIDMDLLMEGSLKYISNQAIAEIEDSTPIATDTKQISSKKSTISPSSTEIYSKSSRKTKSPATSNRKSLRHFFKTDTESNPSITIFEKPFSGYDLGDRRVEVFGKDATYFSKDGTRVSTFYTLIIPMNLEYVILNVVPGNGSNEFWVHRALGEFVKPEIRDICESFRINSKDQVAINIYKQLYQELIAIQAPSSLENHKHKETLSKTPSRKLSASISKMSESKSFHSLCITWPNGHITETVHEMNSPVISHIKQYYLNPLTDLDEDMRCISLTGEVLIFKTSGDIEVLKSDGSFIKITKYGKKITIPEVAQDFLSETSSDKLKKAKGKENSKNKPKKSSSKSSKFTLHEDIKDSEIKPQYELFIEEYETIDTNGIRQKWIENSPIDIEKLLTRTATDFCLGEIFSRRMDGTNILLNRDGILIVTFPNNTRIITNYLIEDEEIYPEWTDEEKEYLFDMACSNSLEAETIKSKASNSEKSFTESYTYSDEDIYRKIENEDRKMMEKADGYISVQLVFTIEHPNFTTITINKANSKISVDSPNNTTVVIDLDNHYDIALDSVTSAKFNGEYLDIKYEACPECRSFTTCSIKIKCDDINSGTKIHRNWLRLNDSFCNKIYVNEEGDINTLDEPSSELLIHEEDNNEDVEPGDEKPVDGKSESSVISHSKCQEMYTAKTIRFFVLRRDLTCSELVHRTLFEQYKRSCCWQPWCSISQYDTYGDHRSLISLLTPIHLTPAEKWLMDSKLANKPKNLTFKDLKKDCGKGFYHWMRPYERFEPQPTKPDNVLPPRLPRAFVLRTLEQQWQDSNREQLKGAKELLYAILRYRCLMEADTETLLHIPVVDLRPEEERRIDDIVQAVAQRVYDDLRIRLADDVQSRAKATITTKPSPTPEEMSFEEELEEESFDEAIRTLEEERESQMKAIESAEEMSPNLKRYWRRRNEEYKEEQFYKYLLQEGSVPPYFRNVLGGSIWWDMNKAAGEAVTSAERRKMKCSCAPDEGTSRNDRHPLQ